MSPRRNWWRRVWHWLRRVGRRSVRPPTPSAVSFPAPAESAVVPTRWEYKILVMLVSGTRSLEYIAGNLWPLYRTQRGDIPVPARRTLRAVLHPMVARQWIRQVDTDNPGIWEYAVEPAGYEALKRCKPFVETWQSPTPDKWRPNQEVTPRMRFPAWMFEQ